MILKIKADNVHKKYETIFKLSLLESSLLLTINKNISQNIYKFSFPLVLRKVVNRLNNISYSCEKSDFSHIMTNIEPESNTMLVYFVPQIEIISSLLTLDIQCSGESLCENYNFNPIWIFQWKIVIFEFDDGWVLTKKSKKII